MNLPNRPQTKASEKTWQVSVPLRPGACTVIDWTLCAVTEEGASNKDGDEGKQHHAITDADSGSESSDSEDADGYTSGTAALPPAIASDPFFVRLLQNAEIHEANEKKAAKRRTPKRRANDAAEDDYDFNDPFIDDSELTFMDGHNHTSTKQRKKRRKQDDGNATEPEGQVVAIVPADGAAVANDDGGVQPTSATDSAELGASALEDADRYEEEDFFVYFGPLNESAENTDEDTFEAPAAKKTRVRKRAEKKQHQQPVVKEGGSAKKRPNGAAAGPKGGSTSDAAPARKKPEAKAQHRRNGSDSAANSALIPTNGRKSGARTSRKLDQTKSTGSLDGAAESAKQRRPPVPERDKSTAALAKAASTTVAHPFLTDHEASPTDDSAPLMATLFGSVSARSAEPDSWTATKRGGTPTVGGGNAHQADQTAEAARIEDEARRPTLEMEAAMNELAQAAETEEFSNRQRFPSTLKPPLRLVCELCIVRALEYDRLILSLDTPEQTIFGWSTPLDIVGFTTGIYNRLADVLPYNRATVRKIVSKLLGTDLITWKERQLKQIEDGLKLRIDEQIESGMGWIPVATRAPPKEGPDDGASAAVAAGGSQVRWHWTTLSKHILFQYMLLTLNLNDLRNYLDQTGGKDGAYREQQARKDAYAHLIKLWPGSSMSTYEISRAYSSRKSLLERQNRKSDSGAGLAKGESGVGTDVAESDLLAARSSAAAEHSEHVPSPCIQQQLMSTPPPPPPHRGDYIHHDSLSPIMAGNRHDEMALAHRLPSPSQMLEDRSAPARFASPPLSHRALHFGQAEAQQQQQQQSLHGLGIAGQDTTLDHQVRNHTSKLFGAASPPRHHHETPQGHPPPGSNGDAGYSSPGSSRYSMSVHNLTSP
ncbi:hypothetical protein GGI19_002015 [Coemansia pectinata]|uniref:Uncharacterized protein n=1 Tax=Coemansia pectinata TaxID=1052879 RepID=A0A9W8GWN0_9FUNG|nr:hypothetical protein GGI19_002015 [Coemansia pectinata]